MAANYYARYAPTTHTIHFGYPYERIPPTVPNRQRIAHRRDRIDPVLGNCEENAKAVASKWPSSLSLYRRNRLRKLVRRTIGEENKEDQEAIYHEFYLGAKKKRSKGKCVGFSNGWIDMFAKDVHSPLVARVWTSFPMLCLGVFGRLPEEMPVGLPVYEPVSNIISLPGQGGGAPRCWHIPDRLGNFGFAISLPRIEILHRDGDVGPSCVLAHRKTRFVWRRCGPSELEMLGGKGHKRASRFEGMKLVRDGGERIRMVGDLKDIVAIYRPGAAAGAKVGEFQFLGGSESGMYGPDWATLALASGLVALSWDGEVRAVLC